MTHFWVSLVYSGLTHCRFIMPKSHLQWLCLFFTQSLRCWHLMLALGFASNLPMAHYFSTQFLCLWSLQWYFLIEILSVSLAVHIFQCVPWDTAQKNLLALLFQIFQIFFQVFGLFFFFTSPFCGSQKLTAVPFERLPLHSKFKAKDIKTMLWECHINTFCAEENDSKRTKIIIGPGFGPTHIALWFPTTIVASAMYLIPILPFQSSSRTTVASSSSFEGVVLLSSLSTLPFPTQFLSEPLLIKYSTSWKPLSGVFHWIFPIVSIFPYEITTLLCWSILLVHQGRLYFALFNSSLNRKKNYFFLLSLAGNNNSWLIFFPLSVITCWVWNVIKLEQEQNDSTYLRIHQLLFI